MTPDEFRRHGTELVEWVASFMERVEGLPVTPETSPGDVRALLPEHAPEDGEGFGALLADLDRIVVPNLTHWQSPNWFAYFPGNTSGPSILGEMASAALGNQGMLWSSGPAATEIEAQVMDWLVDLLDLPRSWKTTSTGGGVIQGTASESTATAMIVARRRAEADHAVDRLVAYGSSQAHSSIEKGARVAGFQHIRSIPVDDEFAMRPDALREAIVEDVAAGLVPCVVVSTVGTTSTTAVDPIREIGEIAREHGMWHHVDAAYAGTAMICPEFRHHQDGLELADSYTFNPHKWMFTNVDCSAFFVADREPLIDALAIDRPYYRDGSGSDRIDYRDWHIPLGRRFRSLKLWWVLRWYGAEGIRHHVREHVRLARELADRITADDRFELVAPVPFGLVCFAHRDGDEATRSLAQRLNETRRVYLTASEAGGRPFIRVSIGQTHTEQRHVDALWELIDDLA
jgi:aromatic-L-amino-acid decarboxylase